MKPSLRRISQSVSNFIEKTYQILDQSSNEAVIDWTSKGQSFIIKDVKSFESEILPKYFKHSNFSSFVRQLNMYNFHKVRGERHDNQFQHERFRKGHRELLSKVKRKQNQLPIASMGFLEGSSNPHVESAESPQKGLQNDGPRGEQHGKQNSETESLKLKLEELQQQNRLLMKGKQKEQTALKDLNVVKGTFVGQKFYKLVACLLTEKLKNQLTISSNQNGALNPIMQSNGLMKPVLSLDELIQHVVGAEDPLDFKNYQQSARTLMKKHTDKFFMLQRTSKQTCLQ